jgi:uncharacterized protein YneF (UPF0154 family)
MTLPIWLVILVIPVILVIGFIGGLLLMDSLN